MSRSRADAAAAALLQRTSASAMRCHVRAGAICRNGSLPHCRHSSTRPRAVVRHCRASSLERRTYAQVTDGNGIAIVGGGLTGLTTAYYLAKKLPATTKITLFEGSSRLGGWIKTEEHKVDFGEERQGTITFERGPRTMSSLIKNNWRFDDLVIYDVALDLGLKLDYPQEGIRRIYYPDHLVRLPPHQDMFEFLHEPLVWHSALGVAGVLLTLIKRNIQGGGRGIPDEDISIAEWLRELSGGDAIGNNIASAMLHGIYGGNIDKLSARSVLDSVFHTFHLPTTPEGVELTSRLSTPLLNSLAKDPLIQRMAQTPKGRILSFGSDGMETLTKALTHALHSQPNVELRTNERVSNVTYDRSESSIGITTSKSGAGSRQFDKVISTLPGQHLACIAGGALPTFSRLESVSIMTVNLYFPYREFTDKGVGYLIPRSVTTKHNPERALGVFFDSSVIPRRKGEPKGMKLFVLMGGHYYDKANGGIDPPSETEAIEQARRLLERHLGISRSEPCYAVAGLATDCIPQHHVGHEARMREAHSELLDKFDGRLAVAGGSYTHIGTAASMAAAYRAADSFAGTDPNKQATGLEHFTEETRYTLIPGNMPVRKLRRRGN